MGSTTLTLAAELKERVESLARLAGKTPHAWMVEGLDRQVALGELRESLLRDAEQSAREIDAGGPLYAAEDVDAFLAARVSGNPARRPVPVKRSPRR